MKRIIILLLIIFSSASCFGEGQDAHRIVLDEMGKHGPITFAVMIGQNGKIEDITVLKSIEIRGSKIERKRFLRQFRGKGLDDPIAMRKDIDAVTGATISSKAAARAARKALATWEKLYANKQ